MAPSGILRSTDTGVDLELTRTIDTLREDVWATLTESDRTAEWFGPWERVSENSIRVQMRFEEGAPWMDMNVDVCESPSRLAVSTTGGWQLDVRLTDATTLTLIHHLSDTEGVGEIGPGWEYYLDNLLASRDGTPLPSFDDYYPAQKEYYTLLGVER
jgi:uncharacterized protein YndB with AHSA1/START domain